MYYNKDNEKEGAELAEMKIAILFEELLLAKKRRCNTYWYRNH
jgi:hypothetical protein